MIMTFKKIQKSNVYIVDNSVVSKPKNIVMTLITSDLDMGFGTIIRALS